MYDYSKATDRIYVGGQINSQADVSELKAAGVTHVVDGQAERDDAKHENFRVAGIQYLWNPTADDGQPKPVSWFKPVLDFAMEPLSQKGTIILSHCGFGINRGPSMGYIVLRAQGFSSGLALFAIHSARPITLAGIRYANDAEVALKSLGWTK
jgi:protein tyrosine phosphatase (PTP) superfamily phosphohydrolase (DUF442 family)